MNKPENIGGDVLLSLSFLNEQLRTSLHSNDICEMDKISFRRTFFNVHDVLVEKLWFIIRVKLEEDLYEKNS